MKDRFPILTVGHSNHSSERFRALLETHSVEVLLDVRSSPYSRRAPQFNRPTMADWLSSASTGGVRYVFAGRLLGGRPTDPSLYQHGRASYARMAQSSQFVSALRRIVAWSRSARCALLCAEAEPLECHRFLLIGRALSNRWVDVRHIHPDGSLEPHDAGERRLVEVLGLTQSELFDTFGDAITKAYELQESRVAFSTPILNEHEIWIGRNS